MSSARASISCSAVSRLRLIAPLLLFLVSLNAVPQDAAVTLRAAGPGTVEARGRQTLSFMLFVGNLSGGPLDLVLDTTLPEGWRELTADGSFRVDAGTTANRLAAILVSARARAGTYPVTFRVRAPAPASAEALLEMRVTVLPEPAVEVRLLESPSFVAAGDPIRALFSLANPGNTDLWVELSVQSRPELPVKLRGVEDPGRLLLPVGEQREVEVEASSPSGLRTATHATLTLAAQPLELPEVGPATASSHVEIIPVFTGSTRRLRTIGGYSETSMAASLDAAPDAYLQSSLNVSGALDEDGRQRLAIEIRKRLGTDDDSFANPIDRFSLTYRNRVTELLLGDHSYSLSPLLAMNELGRGAQAAVTLGPVDLKAMYFEDSWWQPGQGNLGVTAGFSLPGGREAEDPLYRAGLSLLSSLDGRAAFGLWQRFNPLDLLSLQIDAALQSDPDGSVYPALFAEAEGDQGSVYYRARFLRAWTGFEENYADTQIFLVSGGLRLLDRALNLRGAYQISDDNLERDPLLANADHDRRIRFGATWAAAPWEAQLSLDWENNLQVDRLVPAEYSSLENRVRLGWKQQLGHSLGMRFDTSLGRIQYPLTGNGALSQSHGIALSYQPSASRRTDASVSFSGQRGSGDNAWYTFGWNAGLYRGWGRTRLNSRVQNRYYFSGSGLSSLLGGLESELTHTFRWGHSLSTSAYFGLAYDVQGTAVPDLRLSVRYGAPVNIPVGRRPEVAVVRGRVYREETGEPIKGLVLRLDGLAVATNSKGEYAFHLPQAGSLYLQMDRGHIPADLIPNRPVPIEVNATDKDTRLDIGMVGAGELRGAVVGYGLPGEVSPFTVTQSTASPAQYVRHGGFGNVLVELSDGAERRRRLTGPDGDFRFPELRPGHYTLTVGEGFIPMYYRLERSAWEFDIAAGQQQTIEIRAIQDQRRVRLVQADVSVMLEGPAAPQGEWTVTLPPRSEPALPEPVPAPQRTPPPASAADPGAPPEPVAAPPAEAAEATAPAAAQPAAPPAVAAAEPVSEAPAEPVARPGPESVAVIPGPTSLPPVGTQPAPAADRVPSPPPPAAGAPPAAASPAEPPVAAKAAPAPAPQAVPAPAVAPAPPPSATRPAPAPVRPQESTIVPTPAPAPLLLPAPEPTPKPLLFVPAPLPTPAPLLLMPQLTPAPKPFALPAPEPTPVPFFFLLKPAPTPVPSPM